MPDHQYDVDRKHQKSTSPDYVRVGSLSKWWG